MDERRARKHELLQEFNTLVAPQKLKLEQLLPGLWRQCYDGAGSAPAPVPTPDHDADKSGAKREAVKREHPLEDVPPPEPKRAKSADPQARKDELFKECGLIVKRMCGVKSSKWFRKPVDGASTPNYFSLVKTPMDLSTAREKLSKKVYASPMEFKADMDQIWINCFVYNQPKSEAYEDGQKCQKKWEDTWAEFNIEDKWLQLQLDIGTSAPLHARADIMSQRLVKLVQRLQPLMPDASQQREMAFGEKRQLSNALSKLHAAAQCAAVLDIVSQDPLVSSTGLEGQTEVQLDQLHPATLWKLHAVAEEAKSMFLNSGPTAVAPGGAAPASQPPAAPTGPATTAPAKRPPAAAVLTVPAVAGSASAAPAAAATTDPGTAAPETVGPAAEAPAGAASAGISGVQTGGAADAPIVPGDSSGSGQPVGAAGAMPMDVDRAGQTSLVETKESLQHGLNVDTSDVDAAASTPAPLEESAVAPKAESEACQDCPAVEKPAAVMESAAPNAVPATHDGAPNIEQEGSGDKAWESFKPVAGQPEEKCKLEERSQQADTAGSGPAAAEAQKPGCGQAEGGRQSMPPAGEKPESEKQQLPEEPPKEEQPENVADRQPLEPVSEQKPPEAIEEKQTQEPANDEQADESAAEKQPQVPAEQQLEAPVAEEQREEPAEKQAEAAATKEQLEEPTKEQQPGEPAAEQQPKERREDKEPEQPGKEEQTSAPAAEAQPEDTPKEKQAEEAEKAGQPKEPAAEQQPEEPKTEQPAANAQRQDTAVASNGPVTEPIQEAGHVSAATTPEAADAGAQPPPVADTGKDVVNG